MSNPTAYVGSMHDALLSVLLSLQSSGLLVSIDSCTTGQVHAIANVRLRSRSSQLLAVWMSVEWSTVRTGAVLRYEVSHKGAHVWRHVLQFDAACMSSVATTMQVELRDLLPEPERKADPYSDRSARGAS